MHDLKLKDFIKIYNGVLPPSICDDLIVAFEKESKHHICSGTGKDKLDNDYRSAVEMNCSVAADNDVSWKFLLSPLNKVVLDYFKRYRFEMEKEGLGDVIPDSNILEEWRMHRYDADEHFYKKHVDSVDTSSSSRMLAFLFYPNTVPKGGETSFTDHLEGIECTPMQGRLLIFPTWFGFPHQALPVIEGTKYMIKTYLHYPGELEID